MVKKNDVFPSPSAAVFSATGRLLPCFMLSDALQDQLHRKIGADRLPHLGGREWREAPGEQEQRALFAACNDDGGPVIQPYQGDEGPAAGQEGQPEVLASLAAALHHHAAKLACEMGVGEISTVWCVYESGGMIVEWLCPSRQLLILRLIPPSEA